MNGFTRGLFHVRNIFFRDRSAFGELCMATLTLVAGLWLAFVPDVLVDGGDYAYARAWWSEAWWAAFFIVAGGLHFLGVFSQSRTAMRYGALLSGALYATLSAAFILGDWTSFWTIYLPAHAFYCAWLHIRWQLPEYRRKFKKGGLSWMDWPKPPDLSARLHDPEPAYAADEAGHSNDLTNEKARADACH